MTGLLPGFDQKYDPVARERLRGDHVAQRRQEAEAQIMNRNLGLWLSSVHPRHAKYRMEGEFLDTVREHVSPVGISGINDFISDPRGFLILQGDTGLGKTSLAVAVVTAMIEDGVVSTAELELASTMLSRFSQYDAFRRDGSQVEPVKFYSDPDVLVIDDLGVGNEGITGRQQKDLSAVIDNRWGDESKATIITTNMAIRGEAGEGIGLSDYFDRASYDRICDNMEFAQFTGESLRGR